MVTGNLTSKQEAFAQAVADGLNHAEAYRHAYDTGGMKPATIVNDAYMLMQDSDVAAMVESLKQVALDTATEARAWNLDRLIAESAVNVRLGRFLGQVGASNGALATIGKATGLLTDKVDVNVTHTLKPGLSLEELEARYQRLEALESGIVETSGRIMSDDGGDNDD